MHGRSKYLYRILVGYLRERDFLRNLSIEQRIISIWIQYGDVNWTEFAQDFGDL
jgi:hypothetical protein